MIQASGPCSSSFFLILDFPNKPLLLRFSSFGGDTTASVLLVSGKECCLWGVVGLLDVPLPTAERAGDEFLEPGPTAPGIGGGGGNGSSIAGIVSLNVGRLRTGEGPVCGAGFDGKGCPQEDTRRSPFESLLKEARDSCAETGLRPRGSADILLPLSCGIINFGSGLGPLNEKKADIRRLVLSMGVLMT